MVPLVCSASPHCSSQFPVSFPVGSRKLSVLWRSDAKCVLDDKGFFYSQGRIHKHEVFFRPSATGYSQSLVMEAPESPSFTDSSILSPYPSYYDDIVRSYASEEQDNFPEKWTSYEKAVNLSYSSEADQFRPESSWQLDSVDILVGTGGNAADPGNATVENLIDATKFGDVLPNFEGSSFNASDIISEPTVSESISVSGSSEAIIPDTTASLSQDDIASIKQKAGDFFAGNQDSTAAVSLSQDDISSLNEKASDFFAGIQNSSNASVSNAKKAVEDAYDTLLSSIMKTTERGTDSMDSVFSKVLSSFEKSKDQAGDKFSGVSSNLRGIFNETGSVAVDVLRKAAVSFEGLLSNATTFLVFSYGSAKSFLPAEIQDTVNDAEEKLSLIIAPISFALGKVYIAIEGIERTLGIDPNDPLVHLVLLVAGSTTLGVSYWLLLYGGYSGNLSPGLTFELLNKDVDAVLVDIRPENLRERDGIPDLRRRARNKYASVAIPEVDSSVKKQLRGGGEVNETLTASIIRNLKIVKEGANVIILDAGGDQSKNIARSLRKLGVKRAFLVDGGYRSWVKNGLRIKELKQETALDFLNEEAEAILEEIKPTPLSIIGYGLGATASVYALIEWERTLQLIGVIGLAQTIYRRFSSYQSSADLKADIGLLLTPISLGAQALSRATGNSNDKLGLATSPSSTAVQDRVIQAAAKHESQPSDPDDAQTPPAESATEA